MRGSGTWSLLALMTGMRIQEWSTLLLPELGLAGGRRPAVTDVDLAACAKYGRPRSVYVPRDAMELLDNYLLLERSGIVATAQRTLRRQVRDLFVVQRIDGDGTRVRGVLEGVTVTRVIKDMKPGLPSLETGGGLDPLALFIGQGGRMLTGSGWDRIRWRAWKRMNQWSVHQAAPVLPGAAGSCTTRGTRSPCGCFLTREALGDVHAEQTPTATLLEHMVGNPLLVVQRRLGHAHPSTTYRYIQYLKDPMREVDAAFRRWSAAGGASYVTVARRLMNLEGAGAPQG
ncbi:hypothetical protein OG840_53875 [Streptomyces sp. NBC_01764]|uniref:hypothetical protein n=2 Tax=unclassified Streptomyces TaxID=2593676 RepID=UPI002259D44E|nr:hypothetical protein [Streptomyces sp. NBC_01764]MCX4410160.1 hypothetical protein [Streptomyces sp. NBC_01764]